VNCGLLGSAAATGGVFDGRADQVTVQVNRCTGDDNAARAA
jgi:hypothetical protein